MSIESPRMEYAPSLLLDTLSFTAQAQRQRVRPQVVRQRSRQEEEQRRKQAEPAPKPEPRPDTKKQEPARKSPEPEKARKQERDEAQKQRAQEARTERQRVREERLKQKQAERVRQREESGQYKPLQIPCGACQQQTWRFSGKTTSKKFVQANLSCRQGALGAVKVEAVGKGTTVVLVLVDKVDLVHGRVSGKCGTCGRVDRFKPLGVVPVGRSVKTIHLECVCDAKYRMTLYPQHAFRSVKSY